MVIPSPTQGAANTVKAVILSTTRVQTLKLMSNAGSLYFLSSLLIRCAELLRGLHYWLQPCINY